MRSFVELESFRLTDNFLLLTRDCRRQKRLLRSVLEKNCSRCRMRHKPSLVEILMTSHESVELLRSHLLAKLLVNAHSDIDFIRDRTGHQNECFEPAIHTTQSRSNRGVVAVTDKSDAFRINIFACQQQINASPHIDHLLYLLCITFFTKKIIVGNISRASDWPVS